MNMPLRVIQVVNVRWFNATAWYGLSLAGLLTGAGHRTLTLVLPGTAPEAKARAMGLETLSLPLNSLKPWTLYATTSRMAGLIRDFKPHIVNCHRGEGLIIWALLKAAGHDFALLRTRGDQRPPKGGPANRLLYGRLVDAVIAANSRTAAQCRDILDLDAARVHCIPGGVDQKAFAPDSESRMRLRAELAFAPDDFVIGLLGRFDPVKGQRELMQALRRLMDEAGGRLPPLRLLFMGLPASFSREDLLAQARDYGLEGMTRVTGQVEDVSGYINAMDLGVVASLASEAIARAAFEIMACGVPLLGTDVGVMPDLLSPEALVPAADVPAMARLIGRFLSEPEFARRLRFEQRARLPAFSQGSFLEQTLSVYYDIRKITSGM
ncbi:glycosyltransferase [Desulfovibrio sp. OttesenSCG-928-G11]|nr:glycosyltransferase [Desulfovibrio sp. OttesenSCG-928-G11]